MVIMYFKVNFKEYELSKYLRVNIAKRTLKAKVKNLFLYFIKKFFIFAYL